MRQGIRYSPQLDGLRAVCIAFTILNHVEGVPGWLNGSVGVDVFFALSGFLITAILMQDGGSLRSFYIRRVFRIAPVYYLAFGLTALGALAQARLSDPTKLHDLAASWQWIAAFCGEYRPTAAGTFFGHSWTVGIEEKFYLLWPLLFLVVGRSMVGSLLFLASIPFLMLSLGMPELRGYGGIALGSIASLAYFRHGLRTPSVAVGLSLCALAYIAATLAGVSNIAISAAAAVLIPSLYERKDEWLARWLAVPWVASLGRLTFSIYMLHVLCLNVVKLAAKAAGVHHWAVVYAAGYALSVVVASLVYRLYERPLIQAGRRLAQRRMNPIEQTAGVA